MHWVAHFFGIDNLSGPFYGFWSGVGSDLGELALLGGLWHMFNCHDEGCWRVGRHVQIDEAGHHIRRCHKHLRKVTR